MSEAMTLFKAYADKSVRADQYFSFVDACLEARPALHAAHDVMPSVTVQVPKQHEQDDAHAFVNRATTGIWRLGIRGVFSTTNAYSKYRDSDALALVYSTCVVLQWSLFERYVTDVMDAVCTKRLVNADVVTAIRGCRSVSATLDLIDANGIPGFGPLRHALPNIEQPWDWKETRKTDLDLIRRLRNAIAHGDVLDGNARDRDNVHSEYTKTMWTLRQLASCILAGHMKCAGQP